jgi:hypothetical protein
MLPLAPSSSVETFSPASPGCGELREAVTTDDAARKIRRFYGDPEYCWGPLKPVTQRVVGWNPNGYGTGANSVRVATLPKPVSTLMSDGSVVPARRTW